MQISFCEILSSPNSSSLPQPSMACFSKLVFSISHFSILQVHDLTTQNPYLYENILSSFSPSGLKMYLICLSSSLLTFSFSLNVFLNLYFPEIHISFWIQNSNYCITGKIKMLYALLPHFIQFFVGVQSLESNSRRRGWATQNPVTFLWPASFRRSFLRLGI